MLYDRHAMLDIETLGSTPGAPILSIGIVDFHPANFAQGAEFFGRSLHSLKVHVSLESCLAAGLEISAATLKWWMFQPEQARRDAFDRADLEVPLAEACLKVNEFISGMGDDIRIWSHGAPFDPPILDAAMRAVGVKPKWNFRRLRDTRTIFDLVGIDYAGVHHEPILDCTAQAEAVSAAILTLAKTDDLTIATPTADPAAIEQEASS
jgi:hypothetical protein